MKSLVVILCLLSLGFLAGCSTTGRQRPVGTGETTAEQVDAIQKVMGAMGGNQNQAVSPEQLKNTYKDLKTNPESRSAVEKIMGTGGQAPVKYSPATGKHYSGELEFDPETGVKLEPLPE